MGSVALPPERQITYGSIMSLDFEANDRGSAKLLSWPHAWGWAAYGRRPIWPPLRFGRSSAKDGPCPPYGIIVKSCNAQRGGAIFGCGSQQLSYQVDTGDPESDRCLGGYDRVITGERERAIWQVAA